MSFLCEHAKYSNSNFYIKDVLKNVLNVFVYTIKVSGVRNNIRPQFLGELSL